MILESAGVAEARSDRRRRIGLLLIDGSLAGVLASAILLSASTSGGVLLVAGVLGTACRILLNRGRDPEARRSPGWEARVLRALGYGAVLVGFERMALPTSLLLGAWLGFAILVVLDVVEPLLSRTARFAPPLVAHLPGLRPRRSVPDLSRWLPIVGVAAAGLGVAIIFLGQSPWWWLACCLAAVIPSLVIAVDGRAKVLYARHLRRRLPEALAAYEPDFVLYTSRPDDASYQVLMWLPYLQQAGRKFVIMTRNDVPASVLAEAVSGQGVPVIEARRIADVDASIVPSLRAAFYVNASSGNGTLVRYQHLTHVYLGHGDSDKPPSYNPTHAMYDRIFAAGPAAKRRYAAHGVHISPDKFQIVGRPQVAGIRPAKGTARPAQPVVLYAPTWRGHVEETMLYSLPVGERIIDALLQRGATVIFRPHPFSYEHPPDAKFIAEIQERLRADAERTGRRHLFGRAAETERSIIDCINASDAMISDVSSVVSDYLFSGKPFAMIAVPLDPPEFCAEYPVARASYVVRGDLSDLDAALARMLGLDPLAVQRATIRADHLGDFPADGYASVFVNAVRVIASSLKLTDLPDLVEPGDESRQATAAGHTAIDEDHEDTVQLRRRRPSDDAPPGEEPQSSGRTSLRDYREALESTLLRVASTALAVLGVAAVLLFDSVWSAVALSWLAMAAAGHAVRPNLASRDRWKDLLGTVDITRAVIVATWALVTAAASTPAPLAVAAVGGLAVALLAESHIRRAWEQVGVDVIDFPEIQLEVAQRLPRGLVMILGSLTLLVGTASSAAGLPVIGWVLAALTIALAADAAWRAIVRAGRAAAAGDELRHALEALGPQFTAYFASTVGAGYQVGMWLPYFLRVGRPFVFVTRTVPMMWEIASITRAAGVRVPIIYRPTLRSLEEILVPSITTAFYVNNAARNTHLVERRELTHVWLNHGDSEKPACYNPVHAIYDLIFAAGQAGIDRYRRHGVHIPRENFRIVGRPQVENIHRADRPTAAIDFPTVLYAPTWQGPFSDSRVFSLPLGADIVSRLLTRGVRVVFRPHPFNRRYRDCVAMIVEIEQLLAKDRATTGTQHVWGPAAESELTIEECFNTSDAMICDVSAVVSDYLQSDKPFSIVSVGRTAQQLGLEVPAARAAYVLNEDLSNLDAVLNELLGTDSLARRRSQTRTYYLGDFEGEEYADGFLNAAREVIDGSVRIDRSPAN